MTKARAQKEDPSTCEETACKSKVELFRRMGAVAATSTSSRSDRRGDDAGGGDPTNNNDGCPLDREALGQSTWGLVRRRLLHLRHASSPIAPGLND